MNNLLRMVRARRQAIKAAGVPRDIVIWDIDCDGGKQRIAAMIASGAAKASDHFHTVRWLKPGESESGVTDNGNTINGNVEPPKH
jgi:hypothetical protein